MLFGCMSYLRFWEAFSSVARHREGLEFGGGDFSSEDTDVVTKIRVISVLQV